MANAFDSTEYPSVEPSLLVAGDRWAWKRTDLLDYPPATYDLKYEARLHGDGTDTISLTATGSGSDFLIEVASATTAAYTAGDYDWTAFIERKSDNERIRLAWGEWEIRPDPANATNDPRTTWQSIANSLKTAYAAMVAGELKAATVSMGGRTVTYRSLAEVVKAIGHAERMAEQERIEDRLNQGLNSGRKVRIRFT